MCNMCTVVVARCVTVGQQRPLARTTDAGDGADSAVHGPHTDSLRVALVGEEPVISGDAAVRADGARGQRVPPVGVGTVGTRVDDQLRREAAVGAHGVVAPVVAGVHREDVRLPRDGPAGVTGLLGAFQRSQETGGWGRRGAQLDVREQFHPN